MTMNDSYASVQKELCSDAKDMRSSKGTTNKESEQMEKYQSMWEQLKAETEGIEGTVTVPICWVHARMKMMESFWEEE